MQVYLKLHPVKKLTADKKSILKFCKEKKIELAVIGPEEYLATGLSDF